MHTSTAYEYKTIYLNSADATLDSGRTELVFNKLPLIQVRGDRNYLKVVGVTMTGQGDPTGHAWYVKLRNVRHNGQFYFNSDKDAIPTIAIFNWDQKQAFQSCLAAASIQIYGVYWRRRV